MSFRRRTYPEVLDQMLTTLLGGVAGEAHPFPASTETHALQRPAAGSIVSLYGTRNGDSFLFETGKDYALDAGGLTLQWLEGGRVPDDGSLFHVSYLPRPATGTVNDVSVGSVVRTLTESVSLEIARLYAELEAVYESGFIDTAEGRALDNVVALLGVERVRAGRFAGELEFTRASGSRGDIFPPASTRVLSADGNVEYETTSAVTLLNGHNTIRVVARDVEDNSEGVAADTLTTLAKPVAGIAAVTNPAPTAVASQEENDADLRGRAKSFLNGNERATLGAIQNAISRQQIMADVEEPADRPGEVDVTVHADVVSPELAQRLTTAILDVRPAGIKVNLKGAQAPARVNLGVRLTTSSGLLEQDLRAAQDAVRAGIADYFQKLPGKEAGSINRLVSLVLGVDGVEDMRLLTATLSPGDTDVLDLVNGVLDIDGVPTVLGELSLVDTNLPSLVQAVVSYPDAVDPPSASALATAFNETLSYLNDLNASEPASPADPAETARRTLTFGRLAFNLPLPVGAAARGTLASFDASAAPPALPTAADLAPYVLEVVVTSASGVSRVLTDAASTGYVLTPFERLSFAGVELRAETDDV
jgi:uncharacterized phage protein gp47/JayE